MSLQGRGSERPALVAGNDWFHGIDRLVRLANFSEPTMIRPPTEYLRNAEFKTIVAFLGLGLWFSSLVAPVYFADPIGLVGMDDPSPDRPFGGWLLLVLGFVGPIGFAPGWYANLAFGVALYRRFRD